MAESRETLDSWPYRRLKDYVIWRAGIFTRLKWWLYGWPTREELTDRYSSNVFTREEEARIRELIADELGEGSDADDRGVEEVVLEC